MPSTTRYNALARALHWSMALLIIGLFALGLYMHELPKDDPSRGDLFALHKSLGVLTLMMLVLRILWVKMTAPALPEVFAGKERLVIKGLQGVLYLLMFLVPFSGYMLSTAAGYAVSFFGLFELPMLVEKSKELAESAGEMHEIFAFGMILLVVVHAAGAIKHRLKAKGEESDILSRML